MGHAWPIQNTLLVLRYPPKHASPPVRGLPDVPIMPCGSCDVRYIAGVPEPSAPADHERDHRQRFGSYTICRNYPDGVEKQEENSRFLRLPYCIPLHDCLTMRDSLSTIHPFREYFFPVASSSRK
jgi:hypothetical protein